MDDRPAADTAPTWRRQDALGAAGGGGQGGGGQGGSRGSSTTGGGGGGWDQWAGAQDQRQEPPPSRQPFHQKEQQQAPEPQYDVSRYAQQQEHEVRGYTGHSSTGADSRDTSDYGGNAGNAGGGGWGGEGYGGNDQRAGSSQGYNAHPQQQQRQQQGVDGGRGGAGGGWGHLDDMPEEYSHWDPRSQHYEPQKRRQQQQQAPQQRQERQQQQGDWQEYNAPPEEQPYRERGLARPPGFGSQEGLEKHQHGGYWEEGHGGRPQQQQHQHDEQQQPRRQPPHKGMRRPPGFDDVEPEVEEFRGGQGEEWGYDQHQQQRQQGWGQSEPHHGAGGRYRDNDEYDGREEFEQYHPSRGQQQQQRRGPGGSSSGGRYDGREREREWNPHQQPSRDPHDQRGYWEHEQEQQGYRPSKGGAGRGRHQQMIYNEEEDYYHSQMMEGGRHPRGGGGGGFRGGPEGGARGLQRAGSGMGGEGGYGEGPRRKGDRGGGRGLHSEDSGLTWQQQQLLNSREVGAEGGDMGEGRRGEKGQAQGGKRGAAAGGAAAAAAAAAGGSRRGAQQQQQQGKMKGKQQQAASVRPRTEEEQYLIDLESEEMFYGEPPPLRGFNQPDNEFYFEPDDADIPEETVAAAQQAAMFSIKCVENLAPTLAEHAAHAAAHPLIRKPPVAAEVVKVANEAAMAAITGLLPSAKPGRGKKQNRGTRGEATWADVASGSPSRANTGTADQAHSAAAAALRKTLSPNNSSTSQVAGEGPAFDGAWGREDSGGSLGSGSGQQQQRRAAAHTNLFTSVMTQLRRQVDSGEDLGMDNKGEGQMKPCYSVSWVDIGVRNGEGEVRGLRSGRVGVSSCGSPRGRGVCCSSDLCCS